MNTESSSEMRGSDAWGFLLLLSPHGRDRISDFGKARYIHWEEDTTSFAS
ncbi:MAG: hypothetical protein KGQ59_02695 [Bdellovibrionales bacterium]|nr:hypothetical protein [Bdellovibrionales bacterium]